MQLQLFLTVNRTLNRKSETRSIAVKMQVSFASLLVCTRITLANGCLDSLSDILCENWTLFSNIVFILKLIKILLCSALEPPVEGHGPVRVRPKEGREDDQRAGAPFL